MKRGWMRLAAIGAAVAIVASIAAATAWSAARTRARRHDQGRCRLLEDRPARRVRGRVHPGPQARAPVRHQGYEQDRRPHDPAHDRRRRRRSRQGGVGGEGSDRAGLQDHHGLVLVGRRAGGRADRRAEPRAVPLRPRGVRRDHRAEPLHVPRPAGRPTRTSWRRTRSSRAPARTWSCSRRTTCSARATTRRSTPSSAARDTRWTRCSFRCPRPTSRRTRSRRRPRTRTSCSWPGPARRRPPCGGRSTSRAFSTRRPWSRDLPSGRRGGATAMPRARRRSSSSRTTSPPAPAKRGQRLARQEDAGSQPGPGHLHAGRVRAAPDARAGDRNRERDDVDKMISALEGWRFLAPKGPHADPAGGPCDAPADVPGEADPGQRQVAGHGPEADLARQRPAPGQGVSLVSTAGGGGSSTHPRNPRSRARHRRRTHRRRRRARGPRGRVPRDHRPERGRKDVPVQPADGAVPAHGGPGGVRGPGHHARAPLPPDTARPRADVPALARLPGAQRARERPPGRGGEARRLPPDLASRLERAGRGREGAVGPRAGRPRRSAASRPPARSRTGTSASSSWR